MFLFSQDLGKISFPLKYPKNTPNFLQNDFPLASIVTDLLPPKLLVLSKSYSFEGFPANHQGIL